MLADDDFLWQCVSLEGETPKFENKMENIDNTQAPALTNSFIFNPIQNSDFREIIPLRIQIDEIRDDGVLSTTGSEVWEACLFLCAFISFFPEKFLGKRVLEVGCGVGLASFFLIELVKFAIHEKYNTSQTSIVFSDNDPNVLDNVLRMINNRYKGCISKIIPGDSTNGKIDLGGIEIHTQYLDWEDFKSRGNISTDILTCGVTRNDNIDILIGSALCYSVTHTCLADVIKHYLDGICREVVIIQIKDRPGFQEFTDRLTELNLLYEQSDIYEELYTRVLSIRCELSTQQLRSANNLDSIERKCEKLRKEFIFGANFFSGCNGGNVEDKEARAASLTCTMLPAQVPPQSSLLSDINSSSAGPYSRVNSDLFKTDPSAFVILTVHK